MSAHDGQNPWQALVTAGLAREIVRYGSGREELHNLWGSLQNGNVVWPGLEEQGDEPYEEKLTGKGKC